MRDLVSRQPGCRQGRSRREERVRSFIGGRKMVRIDEESANELFNTLVDWNAQLKTGPELNYDSF